MKETGKATEIAQMRAPICDTLPNELIQAIDQQPFIRFLDIYLLRKRRIRT